MDTELQAHLASIATKGQASLTREERMKRQRSLENINAPDFMQLCKSTGVTPLRRAKARALQLNIGLYCNQACSHCHVESSPRRTEMMDRPTADQCLQLIRAAGPGGVQSLDITGGAPELNPQFRYLVEEASKLQVPEIIDRCNLTVLLEPGQEYLPAFLAAHRVRIVASLPCYTEKNTDQQRGAGVFERSIEALKLLNAQGYGSDPGLVLDLVYNPSGAFLAPDQATLQDAYRSELRLAYGIEFSSLLALNNLPIKRFADWLVRRNKLDEYMQLLVTAFNPAAAEGLMCRDTVSVGWDGRVYDCDFNQQLELGMASSSSAAAPAHAAEGPRTPKHLTVFDFQTLDELTGRHILYDSHCYGCTAGAGSSCGGSTTAKELGVATAE